MDTLLGTADGLFSELGRAVVYRREQVCRPRCERDGEDRRRAERQAETVVPDSQERDDTRRGPVTSLEPSDRQRPGSKFGPTLTAVTEILSFFSPARDVPTIER